MRRWPENLGPDRTGKFGLRTGVRTLARPRKNLGPDRTGEVRTSSDFGLQSELLHREELRTGSDRGVFIVFQSLLGISGVLMQTSDWAEKFGLRTGKFGLAIEKFGLRTGKVRTADSVRTFADWESSDWESSDWESSDFGLSPNFRAAQKKPRTGSAWPKQTSDCSPESELHIPPLSYESVPV